MKTRTRRELLQAVPAKERETVQARFPNGAIYEAPPLPGTFDLLAMDGRGYQAWARVYVVDESLVLTSGGDTAEAGDTVILSVEGGMGPYSWTASQGLLSTPSGRAVTWIAPPGDNDPDSGKKVLITVTDSMDSVAAREITLVVKRDDTGYPFVTDTLEIIFPCVQLGEDRFGFSMEYLSLRHKPLESRLCP